MIHLLVGPDHFLVERRIREILATADPDRMNTTRLEKTATLGEVTNAVSTMGFFGTGRVVIAEGIQARASGTGKAKKAEADDIANLFKSIAPGNTLILVDTELHSVPANVRNLKDFHFDQFLGTPPRGSELTRFVADEVIRVGASIERAAITELLNTLFPGDWQAVARNVQYDRPPDLQTLIAEIEKLATASGGKEITVNLVQSLVATSAQDQMFAIVDAVGSGNVRAALTALGELGLDDEMAARVINQVLANAEISPIAAGLRGDNELKSVGGEIGQSQARMATVQRNYPLALGTVLAESFWNPIVA